MNLPLAHHDQVALATNSRTVRSFETERERYESLALALEAIREREEAAVGEDPRIGAARRHHRVRDRRLPRWRGRGRGPRARSAWRRQICGPRARSPGLASRTARGPAEAAAALLYRRGVARLKSGSSGRQDTRHDRCLAT